MIGSAFSHAYVASCGAVGALFGAHGLPELAEEFQGTPPLAAPLPFRSPGRSRRTKFVSDGQIGRQWNAPDDSPVWYFTTWEWQVRQTEPSVLAWLESRCTAAEGAIASGYFDQYPDGTTP